MSLISFFKLKQNIFITNRN